MNAANKVALNTGILYAKMLITMGISLYSTRLVLNYLGESDFGVFNLIAGVIAMLAFLNAAMTTSTQRYLSFHQGTGDFEMQKKVFTNSWVLHIIIGVIVIALLFMLMPFLFGGFLNIPVDRISAAKAIYYFMSVSVFFTIISVPFTASLNAHENMLWIAIVNIIESFLKLGIALLLFWFIQPERLVIYGVLMAALSVLTFSLYAGYCLKRYKECSVKNYQLDKPLVKELGSFAGWNMFGSLCVVGRVQGLAIILNVFYGTVINAAYGIANQVSSQLNFFSAHMLQALNPQIMKSEGMNDRRRMLRLSMIASKFGFFLLALFAIPCIFEMSAILKFWLKVVPDNTVVFCSLILTGMMTTQLTIGLTSAIQAVGKINVYQPIVGGILLINLPIAYILLKMGFPAYSALLSFIGVEFFAILFRLYFLKKIAGLSIREYVEKVVFKLLLPVILSIIICSVLVCSINIKYRFFITIPVSALFFVLSIYMFGLCNDEKELFSSIINKLKIRINFKNK